MSTVFIDGAFGKIAYRESTGTGTVAVLIHGNSSSSQIFARQLEGPLGKTYRLIAMDLPGHGRSADLEKRLSYGIKRYVEVVTDLTRKLKVDDATFVGWSLGGHVVLQAARDLPEAAGFMVFGTPPLGGPADFASAFYPHPATDFIFKEQLSETEIDAYAASGFRPSFNGIPGSVLEDIIRTDGRARAELRGSGFRNEREVVTNLDVPLAILHGAQEQLINGDYFDSLVAPTLWRDQVQTIQDAGHTPQWEQPEIFNALLAAFLEETR